MTSLLPRLLFDNSLVIRIFIQQLPQFPSSRITTSTTVGSCLVLSPTTTPGSFTRWSASSSSRPFPTEPTSRTASTGWPQVRRSSLASRWVCSPTCRRMRVLPITSTSCLSPIRPRSLFSAPRLWGRALGFYGTIRIPRRYLWATPVV